MAEKAPTFEHTAGISVALFVGGRCIQRGLDMGPRMFRFPTPIAFRELERYDLPQV